MIRLPTSMPPAEPKTEPRRMKSTSSLSRSRFSIIVKFRARSPFITVKSPRSFMTKTRPIPVIRPVRIPETTDMAA